MEKQEEKKDRFGILSIIAGGFGIILDFFTAYAFAFSVLAIFLAYEQRKIERNRYARIGRMLGLIGLGIYLFFLLLVAYMVWVAEFGIGRII